MRQIVWIEYRYFKDILDLCEKLGKSPNVVIADIVKEYLEAPEKFAKPVEKEVVIQKIIVCPSCLAEFPSVKEFLEHIKKSEKCKEILKKMINEE